MPHDYQHLIGFKSLGSWNGVRWRQPPQPGRYDGLPEGRDSCWQMHSDAGMPASRHVRSVSTSCISRSTCMVCGIPSCCVGAASEGCSAPRKMAARSVLCKSNPLTRRAAFKCRRVVFGTSLAGTSSRAHGCLCSTWVAKSFVLKPSHTP